MNSATGSGEQQRITQPNVIGRSSDNTFAAQKKRGLTSKYFRSNADDEREGLDPQDARDIERLMEEGGLDFDAARLGIIQ